MRCGILSLASVMSSALFSENRSSWARSSRLHFAVHIRRLSRKLIKNLSVDMDDMIVHVLQLIKNRTAKRSTFFTFA